MKTDKRTVDGFEVEVRRVVDELPDLSYLGSYASRPEALPAFDRQTLTVVREYDDLDDLPETLLRYRFAIATSSIPIQTPPTRPSCATPRAWSRTETSGR